MNEPLPDRGATALDRACAAMGSQQALATALDIRSPSISEWRTRGRVPAERCVEIERVTNGVVAREDLRPDVFGKGVVASEPATPEARAA